MYKTLGEAVDTALALKPLVANANHCEVVLAPVFTAIKTVADRLEGSNVHVAGQNCSTQVEEGAHTGEVAAFMLRDAGARYVIVGHSERRHLYGESDSMVNKKARAGITAGLTVIMCVGEILAQREQGIAENVVRGPFGPSVLDAQRRRSKRRKCMRLSGAFSRRDTHRKLPVR